MLKISYRGNRALLEGDIAPELESQLQREFSWENPDDLNEVEYFYSYGVMYSGIARRMRDYLEGLDYEVEFVEPVLPPRMHDWVSTRPPRSELGTRFVNEVFEGLYGFGKAPCGAGKTQAALDIICRAGLSPTFMVVPNERPFTQAYKTFTEHSTIGEIGRIGDKNKEVREVNVAMIQTLSKELANNPTGEIARAWKAAKVVLVDEQHRGGADSYLNVLDTLSDVALLCGLSATPARPDERQDFLEAVLGQRIALITRAEAIDHKLNVPLTVFVEDIPPKQYGFVVNGQNMTSNRRKKGKTPYDEVYDDYIIYNDYRNKKAIAFCREALEQGLSAVISVSRRAHIEELQRLDPTIVALHSQTKGRDEIFERMTTKEIMLVASTLMDEAVDVPSLSCVAMLAGGKSPVKLEQRIRCDRSFSGDTALGHFEKDRGFVWFPRDTADFLTSHANNNIKLLKEICNEHPLHEFFMNDQLVPSRAAVPQRTRHLGK